MQECCKSSERGRFVTARPVARYYLNNAYLNSSLSARILLVVHSTVTRVSTCFLNLSVSSVSRVCNISPTSITGVPSRTRSKDSVTIPV